MNSDDFIGRRGNIAVKRGSNSELGGEGALNRQRAPIALVVILVLSYVLGHIVGLVLAIVVLVAGYFASVRLNPRIPHGACGGTGRRAGWIYTWTHHRCRGCGGNGRVLRWGAERFGHPSARAQAARQAQNRRSRQPWTWR